MELEVGWSKSFLTLAHSDGRGKGEGKTRLILGSKSPARKTARSNHRQAPTQRKIADAVGCFLGTLRLVKQYGKKITGHS